MSTVDRVFLDTNILVYGRLQNSPLHETVIRQLTLLESGGAQLWISRQIMREFLAVLTRGTGLSAVPPMHELLADIQHFSSRYVIAEDGPNVTQQLVRLLTTANCKGKQVHDANIAATMLAYGIPRLLTHNAADFQRFTPDITIEPLTS